MYITPNAPPEIVRRHRVEVAIVRRVVKDALKAGYTLDVDDGGDEPAITGATTVKAAMDALLNTDEDYLILRRPANFINFPDVVEKGWVRFVYGNDGWDVICDYSVNIEAVLARANALAERLEGR